jgi:hypothetical protein
VEKEKASAIKNPNATVRTRARFADLEEHEHGNQEKKVEASDSGDPNLAKGQVPNIQK